MRVCVCVCVCVLSCLNHVRLCVTPWTIYSLSGSSFHWILQARILEWVVMPFSRDLPDPGIKPTSLTSPALAGGFFTTRATWEAQQIHIQFSSVAQSCPTLCDPMNRSTPGLPVHHQLPEFTQTRVHRVSDAIQPISCSVVPFSSCPQSLPASESFPMSQLFT